jgi:hypothetical protein
MTHHQADVFHEILDGHYFEYKSLGGSWVLCPTVRDTLKFLSLGYEVRIAQPKPRVITGNITVPQPHAMRGRSF